MWKMFSLEFLWVLIRFFPRIPASNLRIFTLFLKKFCPPTSSQKCDVDRRICILFSSDFWHSSLNIPFKSAEKCQPLVHSRPDPPVVCNTFYLHVREIHLVCVAVNLTSDTFTPVTSIWVIFTFRCKTADLAQPLGSKLSSGDFSLR